ncbi:MAG: hypothetical protein AAF961_06200, partial [Planctomycetota bacterium]
WPQFDESLLTEATREIPVQVNGKVRGKITVAAEADRDACQGAALADPRIADLISGKDIVKVVVVPGRMVNIVVRE